MKPVSSVPVPSTGVPSRATTTPVATTVSSSVVGRSVSVEMIQLPFGLPNGRSKELKLAPGNPGTAEVGEPTMSV